MNRNPMSYGIYRWHRKVIHLNGMEVKDCGDYYRIKDELGQVSTVGKRGFNGAPIEQVAEWLTWTGGH